MALILENKTLCQLCDQPIATSDAVVAFPAFIPIGHELATFSDSVFHEECFNAWDKHTAMQSLYDSYRSIWESRPTDLRTMDKINQWGKTAFDQLFAPGMKPEADRKR